MPFQGNSFMLVMLHSFYPVCPPAGGILLITGVLTRFACLIQLPILLGAIIFINSSASSGSLFSELYISIIVFLLLVYSLLSQRYLSLARFSKKIKR